MKKFMKGLLNHTLYTIILVAAFIGFSVLADNIPHRFVNGEPADATKVNENFSHLHQLIHALDESLGIQDLLDGILSKDRVENGEFMIDSVGTSGQVWKSDGEGNGGWQADTDTNAESLCGSNQYLNGSGNCDSRSAIIEAISIENSVSSTSCSSTHRIRACIQGICSNWVVSGNVNDCTTGNGN